MDYTALFTFMALIAAVMSTIIGAAWKQSIWITKQFSDLKDFVNTKVDGVLNKLEYHEKHDDERFSSVDDKFINIRNDIWMLRLDNANYKVNDQKNQSRDLGRENTPTEVSRV